jgi:ComF family protein
MACKALLPLNDKCRCAIWLCEPCEAHLESTGEPLTNSETSSKPFHFSQNRSAFVYVGILRDLIRDIKFRSKKNYARALGRLWAEKNIMGTERVDDVCRWHTPGVGWVMVPVPLHPKKQRERGFNQAELLARELSLGLDLPMQNILQRVVDTLPQAGLHPKQRMENVADAFRITPGCTVSDKSLILVDDIFTTGASLNECARVLMAHGAKEVTCMTLSITLTRKPED